MKKLIMLFMLFCAYLCSAQLASAQTSLYNETFSGGNATLPGGSGVVYMNTFTGWNPNVTYAGSVKLQSYNNSSTGYVGSTGGYNLLYDANYSLSILGINIANYTDLKISFGHEWWYSYNNGGQEFAFEYSIDGGTWTNFTSFTKSANGGIALMTATGFATANTHYVYVTLPIGTLTGNVMNLRLSRPGYAGMAFDDLNLTGTSIVSVTGFDITTAGDVYQITSPGGTLQFSAGNFAPSNTTFQKVRWSVITASGSGLATIDATGLLTVPAHDANGTVTVVGTAFDGSGITDWQIVTVSGTPVYVTGLTVIGQGGASAISTLGGSFQLSVTGIVPSTATDKSVTWSVVNGFSGTAGQATVNSVTGVLTASTNGLVEAVATANDGSGVWGSLVVSISGQVFSSVTGVSVSGPSAITSAGQSIVLSLSIAPVDASLQTLALELQTITGVATLSTSDDGTSATITGVNAGNGTVKLVVKSKDETGALYTVTEYVVTISGQTYRINSLILSAAGGATTITQNAGTLQLTAAYVPTDATPNLKWSVNFVTGRAKIDQTGLLTGISNGVVSAKASANDGSGISATYTVTLSGQSQSVLVADFETVYLASSNTWGTGSTSARIGNPLKKGINKSDSVLTHFRSGTGYPGIAMYFNGVNVYEHPYLSFHFYTTATGVLNFYLSHDVKNGDGTTTYDAYKMSGPTAGLPISPDQWARFNFDFTDLLAANPGITWDKIVFQPNNASNGDNQWYNYDNFVFGLPFVPVTAISVATESGEATLAVGDSVQLLASVTPGDASDTTVVWSISDGFDYANLSPEGMLTGLSAGVVKATATSNDGEDIVKNIQIEITAAPTAVAGKNDASISVYPNPASGTITVSSSETISSAVISDIFGKPVKSVSNFGKLKAIDISDIAAGTYLLYIQTVDGRSYAKRFVKQ